MKQLGRANRELIEVTNLISEAQSTLNKLRIEESEAISSRDKAIFSLNETLNKHRTEIIKHNSLVSDSEALFNKTKVDISLLEDSLSLLQKKHELMINNINIAFTSLNDKLDKIDSIKKEIEIEENLLKSLSDKKVILETLVISLENKVNSAKDEIAKLNREVGKISIKKRKLEEDILKLENREKSLNLAEERLLKREHFVKSQYTLLGLQYKPLTK